MPLPLRQGWATIFVRGPQCAFFRVSRAKKAINCYKNWSSQAGCGPRAVCCPLLPLSVPLPLPLPFRSTPSSYGSMMFVLKCCYNGYTVVLFRIVQNLCSFFLSHHLHGELAAHTYSGSRIIESPAYCNQNFMARLYLNSRQNTSC